jgi:hypothetical protein
VSPDSSSAFSQASFSDSFLVSPATPLARLLRQNRQMRATIRVVATVQAIPIAALAVGFKPLDSSGLGMIDGERLGVVSWVLDEVVLSDGLGVAVGAIVDDELDTTGNLEILK